MNFPVEAMADLPDEHKAAFLAQLEHMQVRDRCVGRAAHAYSYLLPRPALPAVAQSSAGLQADMLRLITFTPRKLFHVVLPGILYECWRLNLAAQDAMFPANTVASAGVVSCSNQSPADNELSYVFCSLKLYNSLVERCFRDCVDDFRSKNLAKDEEKVCSAVVHRHHR